jgi:hypothetical protein
MAIRCNADRAARAREALEAYRGAEAEDDCHLGDLIGDLLHLAREEKRKLVPLVQNAVAMFQDEIREPHGDDRPNRKFSIYKELFGEEP